MLTFCTVFATSRSVVIDFEKKTLQNANCKKKAIRVRAGFSWKDSEICCIIQNFSIIPDQTETGMFMVYMT